MRARQPKTAEQNTGNRVLAIAFLFVAWMLVIIGRLYWLQVAKHDYYLAKARENQQLRLETMAARGPIVDRNGKELALSVLFDSVFVDQRLLKDDEARRNVARTLATVLEIGEAELVKQVTGNSGFVFLARRLDPEKARAIKEVVAKNGIKAIGFKKEMQRFYPNESLAAAVLGYVGAENKGQAGMEQSQNNYLDGKSGSIELERDGRNRAYERRETPAVGGATVTTTIDSAMQHKIETLLTEAVKRHSAKGAYAVVMDVATGEVLALANAPGFNPNERPKSSGEDRHNRAISWPYEPGSIFKMITYAAAFEEGKVQLDEKLNCGNGEIRFGPRVIHDTHAYGVQQTPDAFAKSSNVCAIRLAQRVGKEKFAEYISLFGFGSKTGIELPAESKGIVRPAQKWNFDSIGSVAMGQEVSVTMMQIAAATGAIANKGIWVQPHVVKEIIGADGRMNYQAKPVTRQVVSRQTAENMSVLMQRVVTHGTARHAIQLANYTAAGKTGTPQKAERGHGYARGKFMPSFAGFVPATDPKFVIVVMVDEPAGAHQGGSVSAPVFNMIAQIALGDFAIPPDAKGFRDALAALSDRYEAKAAEDQANEGRLEQNVGLAQPETVAALPAPQTSASREMVSQNIAPDAGRKRQKPTPTPQPKQGLPSGPSAMMPDLRGKGLRSVIQTCSQLSLNVRPKGSGVVVKQWPAPGARVRPGEDCKVEFQ